MDKDDKKVNLLQAATLIGKEISSVHAQDVDAKARFPVETFSALREQSVLSAAVPEELGGGGCDICTLTAICESLGQHCAASGMILAMHYIQVASIAKHCGEEASWLDYLKSIVDEQRLIASVTSEDGVGGELRRSIAGVELEGDRFKLQKKALTISYGAQADDLLITARRNATATENDQVLVLARKGEYTLTDCGSWDTVGMRGTCSPGAVVTVTAAAWQILPAKFGDIAAETMVPYSHILWSGVWLGIATDALKRTRELIRGAARKQRGQSSLEHEFTKITMQHQAMRDGLAAVAEEYRNLVESDPGQLSGIRFGLRINNLKLDASQKVIDIVSSSMQLAGVPAYKNGTPFSLGRHLRDAHSAVIMIHNQRIVDAIAPMHLIHRGNNDGHKWL
jgi:acyl-CoA dehydrogenase